MLTRLAPLEEPVRVLAEQGEASRTSVVPARKLGCAQYMQSNVRK